MTANRMIAATLTVPMLFTSGCATYVNIPAQEGDVAWHSPNNPSVIQVQTAALKAVADDWKLQEAFAVKALPDTAPDEYAAMLPKISDHATGDPTDQGLRLQVKRLNIRGSTAMADILAVPVGQTAQLITVYLNWRLFDGWYAKRMKVWKIDALRPQTVSPN